MQLVRHPSRRHPPVTFGDGGASAHAPDGSVESFELAVMLGATGIAARVHLTGDGIDLVSRAPAVGRWPRRRRLDQLARDEVPELATLDDVLDVLGDHTLVSLEVADATTAGVVLATMARRGRSERLWLCHDSVDELADWRDRWPAVALVHRGRIESLESGPERHVARLAEQGIDGFSMPGSDWTGGLTTLIHRFGLDAVATEARVERVFVDLVRMGIDAVHTAEVERLVDVVAREAGPAGAPG
ncbi:MAG: hypothetical protein AAGA17_05390 [Actinomycetota bacterium]